MARSAGKWIALGTAVAVLAGPLFFLVILAALIAGPASANATIEALGDDDPEYCLIDFYGIEPDDFLEFEDGRNVRLDPVWCNISCVWYESPLTESDILRAGFTKEIIVETTTVTSAGATVVETITTTVTLTEAELTADQVATTSQLRAATEFPRYSDHELSTLANLCATDPRFSTDSGFTADGAGGGIGSWAGGPIGASLAALPRMPITERSAWEQQNTRPHTLAFAEAIKYQFNGINIMSLYQTAKTRGKDHNLGLGIDVTINPHGSHLGYDVMSWVRQAHYEGIVTVTYMIYNRQIFYAKSNFQTGSHYSCDGSPSDCHTNHVHISLAP